MRLAYALSPFALILAAGCSRPDDWTWEERRSTLTVDQSARQAELIAALPHPTSLEGESSVPYAELFSLADEVGTHIDGETMGYKITIPDSGDGGSDTPAWFMVRDQRIVEVFFQTLSR